MTVEHFVWPATVTLPDAIRSRWPWLTVLQAHELAQRALAHRQVHFDTDWLPAEPVVQPAPAPTPTPTPTPTPVPSGRVARTQVGPRQPSTPRTVTLADQPSYRYTDETIWIATLTSPGAQRAARFEFCKVGGAFENGAVAGMDLYRCLLVHPRTAWRPAGKAPRPWTSRESWFISEGENVDPVHYTPVQVLDARGGAGWSSTDDTFMCEPRGFRNTAALSIICDNVTLIRPLLIPGGASYALYLTGENNYVLDGLVQEAAGSVRPLRASDVFVASSAVTDRPFLNGVRI